MEAVEGEVSSGPLSRYYERLRSVLGDRVMDAVYSIERPSAVADMLLAAYTPPYDAKIGGVLVPTSPEAIRFARARAAGERAVDIVIEPEERLEAFDKPRHRFNVRHKTSIDKDSVTT